MKNEKVLIGTDYTIYVPENADRMAIYCHAWGQFPHTKGKPPRSPYNFQENIVDGIQLKNPTAVAVAMRRYNNKLIDLLYGIIKEKGIKELIISGWSMGGSDALTLAAKLYLKVDVKLSLILIDANYTNDIAADVFLKLRGVRTVYISNTFIPAKVKKISKLMSYKLPLEYMILSIPKDYKGSNHMFCRNSTIDNDMYGYVFGNHGYADCYRRAVYDYDGKVFIIE